jgi:hypothetical protein
MRSAVLTVASVRVACPHCETTSPNDEDESPNECVGHPAEGGTTTCSCCGGEFRVPRLDKVFSRKVRVR